MFNSEGRGDSYLGRVTNTEARTSSTGPRVPVFLFLQASAFLSSAGTGLAMPVLPFIVARYTGDPARVASTVGWLVTSYSLCAFFAAPALGALSDVIGRRPVLLLSLAGSAAGYALFGFSNTLPLLFLGRVVDGLTAGNTGALFAYLGDTTPAEERGRYFGRVGAMFGVGLLVGPALGGLTVKLGLKAPFFLAAILTTLNVLWGYVFLSESLPPERRVRGVAWHKLNPFSQLAQVLGWRHLRPLLIVGVLFTAAIVSLQGTFALLVKDRLGWSADAVSFSFIVIGVTDVLVQGVLLDRLSKVLGEASLLAIGLSLTVLGLVAFAVVAAIPSVPLVLGALVAFAGGEGLFTASFAGLLSRAAGPSAQGQVQGGSQALQELMTVLAPLVATQLYARVGVGAPYWVAIGAAAVAGLLLRASVGASRLSVTRDPT